MSDFAFIVMSKELMNEIFSLDPGIRYAAVLSPRGTHLEGGMRPGIASVNPESEEDKLFLQATVARGMSDSWTKFFGSFKFSFFIYERLSVIQLTFGENVLLVTTEPGVPISLAQSLVEVLQKHKGNGP